MVIEKNNDTIQSVKYIKLNVIYEINNKVISEETTLLIKQGHEHITFPPNRNTLRIQLPFSS